MKFEKSKFDKERKKGPKEGTKAEEQGDKKQLPSFACGGRVGKVKRMAEGGMVRGTGCATKGKKFGGTN